MILSSTSSASPRSTACSSDSFGRRLRPPNSQRNREGYLMLDRRSWIVAGATAALLTASGLAQAQDKPNVKIAAIVPISGAGAFDGQLGLEGMKAMAEAINAKGGILGGRKLELVIYDDKGTPEEGVSAAKRAI